MDEAINNSFFLSIMPLDSRIFYKFAELDTKTTLHYFKNPLIKNPLIDIMEKQVIPLLLAMMLLTQTAIAGPRSRQQAQAIAQHHAAQRGITIDSCKLAEAPRKVPSASSEPYYVFNYGQQKGYAIVSADDRLPEIVGYGLSGDFDKSSMPDGLAWYLEAYAELANGVANGDEAALAIAAEAQALRTSPNRQAPTVSPLLGNISWGQNKPYNDQCPEYEGSRCVTGCTATAMAQVMRYWKYPTSLKANIPAYTSTWYGISIPEITDREPYDWDNMTPTYEDRYYTYTETEGKAVAKLMYHCAAALKSEFTPSATGAMTSDIPQAMATYFGYDTNLMIEIPRREYDLATWTALLDNELTSGRPVIYSGVSYQYSHAFVIDGADGSGFYHVNWGWTGASNNYFDITILDPYASWKGNENATTANGYSRGNSMVIGIQPNNGTYDEPLNSAPVYVYRVVHGSEKWNNTTRSDASGTFSGEIWYYLQNSTFKKFDGYVALGLAQADGSYDVLYQEACHIEPEINGVDGPTIKCKFDYAFPVGINVLVMIYSTDGKTWKKCRYYSGDVTPLIFKATETTLLTDSFSPLTATIAVRGELLGEQENTFDVTFTNHANTEYYGTTFVYANTTDTKPDTTSSIVVPTIPAGGSVTRSFTYTPSAGDLYFWITDYAYDETLIAGPQKFTVPKNADPILSFVSLTTNATPGDYETEKAYYWNGLKVKAPRVNDTKATFTAAIRNDGGTCRKNIDFFISGTDNNFFLTLQNINTVLTGGGAVTEVTAEISAERAGTGNIYCQFCKYADMTYPDDQWNLYYADGSGYATESSYIAFVYVTGVPSAITSISDTPHVAQPVYSLSGQRVATTSTGSIADLGLPAGMYIVGGRKMVVR